MDHLDGATVEATSDEAENRSPAVPELQEGESHNGDEEGGQGKQWPVGDNGETMEEVSWTLPERPQPPADDVVDVDRDDAMIDANLADIKQQPEIDDTATDPPTVNWNVENDIPGLKDQGAGTAETVATRAEDPARPEELELVDSVPDLSHLSLRIDSENNSHTTAEEMIFLGNNARDSPTNELPSSAEPWNVEMANSDSATAEPDPSRHGSLALDADEEVTAPTQLDDPGILDDEMSSEEGADPNVAQEEDAVGTPQGDTHVNATREEDAAAASIRDHSSDEEPSAAGAADSSAEEEPGIYSHPVCGIWGTLSSRSRPHADLKALYLLFESVELGESTRKEIPTAEGMATQITDSAFEQAKRGGRRRPAGSASPSDATSESEGQMQNETKSPKSANSEFVDGLDDIGKFFEDVEPPDELDVGAVGTSIQEVLMGQGTRIILKRLHMGLTFLRRAFLAAKDKVSQRFVDEDGNLTIVDPETLESAARWIWTSSKQLYHKAQAYLDSLIERGIAGGLSREYEEEGATASLTSPENIADMRELLRQYSRVGGAGNPPKKVAY
jgi:hypothetical protein